MKTIGELAQEIERERAHVSLTAQLQEIDYELAMRERVYQAQIFNRKMRESVAVEHMRRMRAVRQTIVELMKGKSQ